MLKQEEDLIVLGRIHHSAQRELAQSVMLAAWEQEKNQTQPVYQSDVMCCSPVQLSIHMHTLYMLFKNFAGCYFHCQLQNHLDPPLHQEGWLEVLHSEMLMYFFFQYCLLVR